MQDAGLTRRLAGFAARPELLEIDDEVRRIVTTGFIDTAATTLAGRGEPAVRVLRDFVAARSGPGGPAHLLYGRETASPRDAALVNATAGHALDYDDVGLCGHPSTVLVPALLAEGERLHASGAALIRAYVVGYETWAELLSRDADLHHLKGWHPTAVFGVVAVAAAVAALRGLDAERCRDALGIAASMAGGLVANFGSMVKPFHAGQAASNGIDAVELAARGLRASPDVLEHHAGYLAAISPGGRVDREADASQLGRQLRIARQGLSVKKYPMCYATHRVIDATLALVKQHDVLPEQLAAASVEIGPAQASMLRNHEPRSGLEAKFSIEFAVAAAVVARRVGLRELDDDFVTGPVVQGLFGKVRTSIRNTVSATEPSLAESDRVVLELRDGRRLDSGDVEHAFGDARFPLEPRDLSLKFLDCAAMAPDVDARRLFERLQSLETAADIAELLDRRS